MKKLLSILAITVASFSVTAQEKREAPKTKEGMHHMQHAGKHHDGHMMKDLNLTDAQRSQMKANREEYKNKIELLKKDQNIKLKDYNVKKEALQKEQRAKMQALLTPEQKSKMAEMKAKKEQEREERYTRHFEKMKTELALTDDQAAKLKTQHESTMTSMKAIRENESLGMEEKKQQLKALKESSKEQRKNILTADQLKKMEEMHKNKEGKHSKKTV